MAAIGKTTAYSDRTDALARARERAALVPELVVQAQRIANTVIAGWHGRKKRGIGETFWQYRPYVDGETLARIDWRRSARDDETYVRDLEWEAAQTVWLWCDTSASMLFQSNGARISKEHRAMVLAFALAELLAKGGERLGYPGLLTPSVSRNGAQRLAAALMSTTQTLSTSPDLNDVKRFNDVVLISDFLHDIEGSQMLLQKIADRGARAHFLEVCDPAEETFPYQGRTEFRDPETGVVLRAGRAEQWADDYIALRTANRKILSDHCRRMGWSYTVSYTDDLASNALLKLYGHLTGQPIATPERAE